MFDQRRIAQDFSRAAAQYDAHALLQQKVLANLLERTRPFLSSDTRILDAGCGTGQLARLLNRRSIFQLDISYVMCTEAFVGSEATICADMTALPFEDGFFDIVFSSLALQWLPDMQAALQELSRTLKAGGILAVSTMGANTLRELRASFAEVDNYPHVSPFLRADKRWERETVTEYFPDLSAVMRGLKAIGANNKLSQRRKGLMPRGLVQKVEEFYRDHFGSAKGLPVTWEILYRVERV